MLKKINQKIGINEKFGIGSSIEQHLLYNVDYLIIDRNLSSVSLQINIFHLLFFLSVEQHLGTVKMIDYSFIFSINKQSFQKLSLFTKGGKTRILEFCRIQWNSRES